MASIAIAAAVILVVGPTPSRGSAAGAADIEPPSVPQGMAFAGKTRTTVTLVWRAASDDVGVTGYRLYRNGARVTMVRTLRYTFSGLRCGTRYTVALEAVDAAGNASNRAEATGSITTSACVAVAARQPRKVSPPKSGTANVWVDPNGGSCRRYSTPRGYADGEACRGLQAAYDTASTGDTVNIADGTYGGQGLRSGTKRLTFRASGPGRPSFGQLISAASNITVRGILIQDRANFNGPCSDPDNAVLRPCGANQTYDNVIVDGLGAGGNHGIRGVGSRFTLRGSEVRNIVDQKGFEGGSNDMVIENNDWHDITVTNPSVHNECMYVDSGNRAVYRGNRFIGCPTMALFFTNWNGGPPYGNVTVENNVFAHTLDEDGIWHGSCALNIGGGFNNQNTLHGWKVRYNTFETGTCVTDLPGSNSTWIGNLGGIDCVKAFTYRHNVGQTCGGRGDFFVARAVNSRLRPNEAPFYVNAPAGDFRLRAGAAAINRGDPQAYPRLDSTKRLRPVGSAPDAGAFEFRP